jgi:Ca2+-binding RTX toxin-like protein
VNGVCSMAGRDTFDYDGGTGADTMVGGAGDDRYFAHDAGDLVIEAPGEELGVVFVYIADYTLPDNIENGSIASDGTFRGNGSDNLLGGFSGDDVIEALRGAGTLHGSFGADTFLYQSASDSAPGSYDLIDDFHSESGTTTDDQVDLSAIDANTNVAGDQAFDSISHTVPNANGLWWTATTVPNGQDIIFYGDTDGNTATIEFELHIHADAPMFFDDLTLKAAYSLRESGFTKWLAGSIATTSALTVGMGGKQTLASV